MTENVLIKLDQIIAERSILNHPFYQAWSAGELTQEQLASYASIYYPHVEAFPSYLQEAMKTTDDTFLQKILQENFEEEVGTQEGLDPHPELWLQFATGVGASRNTVLKNKPSQKVQEAIDMFSQSCQKNTVSALSALYAYESQQPEVSSTKRKGLCEFYGINNPATVAYFAVHEEADIRHREEEREALAYCLQKGAKETDLFSAANQALDAHWMLLDSVCEHIGMEC